VGGSNSDYATAVTRRIVQTNDIAHDCLSVSLPTSAVNSTLFISEECRVTPTQASACLLAGPSSVTLVSAVW
jgi:hypothetical protein